MLTQRDKPSGSVVTPSGGAPGRASAADRALRCGADELGVLGEHAAGVAGLRRGPALAAAGQLLLVDQQVEGPGGEVEADAVAVPDEGDRPAVGGLGRDVTDAQSRRPAGEPAVGEEEDVL